EGKYALVKDPSKPEVRIYEVPADAFENDYVEEPLPDDEQVQPPEENNNAEARAGAGAGALLLLMKLGRIRSMKVKPDYGKCQRAVLS
ncbi:unnamed protein product, partial [Brassica oleracea]